MRTNKSQIRNSKGITLIALVITIIVLLILAGVSIAMLTGQNGILTQAQSSKGETEKASLIEKAKLDIMAEQSKGNISTIPAVTLQTILKQYFGNVPENANDLSVETTILKAGEYDVPLSEIYNGEIEKEIVIISKTESCVGDYADIDGDGNVDGIIYADLAVGGSGRWDNRDSGAYAIPTVESGLKEYYIKSEEYNGDFGSKPVIAPMDGTSGESRFYVMALKDIDDQQHYWYYAASELDDSITSSANNLGVGKANTTTMIDKWKVRAYGSQNANDVWGLISEQVENGWFVPSRSEWAAFGGELGITKDNYQNYNLKENYWSSTQGANISEIYTTSIYLASFRYYGYMRVNAMYDTNAYAWSVDRDSYVRLSTTF